MKRARAHRAIHRFSLLPAFGLVAALMFFASCSSGGGGTAVSASSAGTSSTDTPTPSGTPAAPGSSTDTPSTPSGEPPSPDTSSPDTPATPPGTTAPPDTSTPPAPPVTNVVTLTRVASGLDQPLQITHAGDGSGRLFITEKRGTVRIIRNGLVLQQPFLDIRSQVRSSGNEQGLLGIAFPPDFATDGHFYVNYTGTAGIGDSVIARIPLGATPDQADPAGTTNVLTVPQPFENHNGGQMAFGPDGFLYIGLGDGGGAGDTLNNAQNRTQLLGKILRIDVGAASPTYAVPAGNPFGNEIWSYGLRNPWRFSFDRDTGDLYIADVGQDQFEEINFQPAGSGGGQNYGWRLMEGAHCFDTPTCDRTGLVLPVHEYAHDAGCSVTGGYVYRGPVQGSLQGTYIYGDFCSGRIWGLRRIGDTWENRLLFEANLRISSFGEDEEGNLYVADFSTGDIYRFDIQ